MKNSLKIASIAIALCSALALPGPRGAALASEGEGGSFEGDFFRTETVYPEEEGSLCLSLSPSYSSYSGGAVFDLWGSLEYGVTGAFSVGAGWNVYRSVDPDQGESESGTGDFSLGARYAFDEFGESGVRSTVGIEVTFPTGDDEKGLGEGAYVYEPYVVLSRNFGPSLNAHLSVAYAFVDPEDGGGEEGLAEAGEMTDELEASLGFAYALGGDWVTTLEFSLETDEIDNGEETEASVAPGVIWQGAEGWDLGTAVAVGVTDDAADWEVLAMASWELDLFSAE